MEKTVNFKKDIPLSEFLKLIEKNLNEVISQVEYQKDLIMDNNSKFISIYKKLSTPDPKNKETQDSINEINIKLDVITQSLVDLISRVDTLEKNKQLK